jgi:carboxyl-terminal processing protease
MDKPGYVFEDQGGSAKTPPARVDDDSIFNGIRLCTAARDALEKTHRHLTDPAKRAAFDSQWTAACKTDPRTSSESGTDKLVQEMITSMGERFDHYFDRQGLIALHDDQSGRDIGLGIETEIRGAGQLRNPQPYEARIAQDHPLQIRSIEKDSPAEKAGLLVGDQISAIDGVSTAGLKRREALAKMEGQRDAVVHLQISRPLADGTFATKEVEAKETLVVEPTASYRNIGDGVGYIKLRNFMADDAADQMFKALGQTVNDKAIVIDLRNNNGGRTGLMQEIAEQILPRGQILRTEERNDDAMRTESVSIDDKGKVHTIRSDAADELVYPRRAEPIVPDDKPIVILVDEYSASAAEMLAGALRANNRAVLVGVPTTGKSEGQLLVDLPYNRGASLTYYEFYPGGQSVPHSGLEPDVLVPRGDDATVDNQLEAAKHEALYLAGL